MELAEFHNQIRFLSLDLSYGNDVRGLVYEYLSDNGMSREEYHWFIKNGQMLKNRCVMGNDYYITNEHLLRPDGRLEAAGEIFGY